MKKKHMKLIVVFSISFLLITFQNNTYADTKKSTAAPSLVKTPMKPVPVPFHPDIKQFAWVAGQPLVKMLPVSEGLCALTGVSGNFRGGGEVVYVTRSGGYWVLGGQSLQDYLWAQAHCIKYKDLGKDFANIRYSDQSDWLGCNQQICYNWETIAPFYYGSCRAGFLQGVSGDFEKHSFNVGAPPGVAVKFLTWQD